MLRVYNNTARYVDQGGNKVRHVHVIIIVTLLLIALLQRPGAFAIYLEPWHADIFDFLDAKKNTGKSNKVKIVLICKTQYL